MRCCLPLFIILTVAACGPSTSALGDPQEQELAALDDETGAHWTMRLHPDVGTAAFLEGRTAPLLDGKTSARSVALAFLDAHAVLWKLTSADDELLLASEELDELGMTHVRFVQRQGGVPVLGGELSVHFDAAGALVRVRGRFVPLPTVALVPVLTVDEARTFAITAALGKRPQTALERFLVRGLPELAIAPAALEAIDQQPRLVWRVEVFVDDANAPARFIVLVDAQTAEALRTDDVLASLTGSGRGVHGERLPLEIVAQHARYELATEGRTPQRTYAATGNDPLPGRQVTSSDADRWDEQGPGAGAAVDAHAFVAAASGYFSSLHGRPGPLGDGHGLHATVHWGAARDGAFFDGRQLVFGDGDGIEIAPPAGALDVVAHEVTHAVIESTSGLGMSGESGALNEGLADIFGCTIERAVRGRTANWTVGEDAYWHGRGLRDLADPHRLGQPAHLSERVVTDGDRGGIHDNATIVGHAAWLLATGGVNAVSHLSVKGVGVEAAERVWYRALSRYLGPGSGFRDAVDATLASAKDLYGDGSPEASSVADAWRAVGVLGDGP